MRKAGTPMKQKRAERAKRPSSERSIAGEKRLHGTNPAWKPDSSPVSRHSSRMCRARTALLRVACFSGGIGQAAGIIRWAGTGPDSDPLSYSVSVGASAELAVAKPYQSNLVWDSW